MRQPWHAACPIGLGSTDAKQPPSAKEAFARENIVRAGLARVQFLSAGGTQCYLASNADGLIAAWQAYSRSVAVEVSLRARINSPDY
jgi:hypothetical protein